MTPSKLLRKGAVWAGVFLLLVVGGSPLEASDASTLRPFAGETLQQFEARKRALERSTAAVPAARPFTGEAIQDFEARMSGIKRVRPDLEAGSVITVPADSMGHFVVHPTVDGHKIRMLVDTGASVVALTHEDAMSAGIRVAASDFTINVGTANGITQAAPIKIAEMQVGSITVRNIDAVVHREGSLHVSLLGMTFLKRLGGFEISQGRLTLR